MACTTLLSLVLLAADDAGTHSIIEWPPHTVQGALLTTALFGLLGILLAVIGFKLFDGLTPGNLQKEVFEKNNIAAGILGAAVVLGVCAIIAAAVHS